METSDNSNERLNKAREIVADPSPYKVCEGCESIVGKSVVHCPNCHAYRFDSAADRVCEQALILGHREKRSVTADDLT